MTTFDAKDYEVRVLKQLRKHLPHLPGDLEARYAVEPGMDADATRDRVDAVVRLWNKHAMGAGPLGYAAQQLVDEHNEFVKAGRDPATTDFWVAWSAQRSRTVGDAIAEFAKELDAAYGKLGCITAGMLRAAAATRGDLGAAELEQARNRAGLALVEPVELPTSVDLRGSPRTFADAMLRCGALSIPALLFPDLTTFGLLDGFTVTPKPAARTEALTAAAVTERMDELERLPDSSHVRAVRSALGFVKSEAEAGTDLRALALFHLLGQVRRLHAENAPQNTLYDALIRDRLRRADAGRIVISLMAQGAVPRDPAAAVDELLTEGRLAAAQRAAAALPDAEGEAARAAVERQRQRVDRLRSQAEEHLAAGRVEQARARLHDAIELASDLAGLPELLAGIPTTPVSAVSATPSGAGVRVTWQRAPTHGRATVFRVVRRVGRAPDAVDDGVTVPVENGHATDAGPPVGHALHYAVFARDADAPWSRPTGTSTLVVPPVTDLVIEGGAQVVHGRWTSHQDVVAVDVRRTAGTPGEAGEPVAVEGTRGFHDTDVVDGMRYFYTAVAVYPSPRGGPELRSAPVSGWGTTRPVARPVEILSATPLGGGGPTVRLTWTQQAGVDVRIRRAAKPCPWKYGMHVRTGELERYGALLDDRDLAVRGGSTTLVAAVPSGRSWLVAFTLDADGAVRGREVVVELVEPVRQVQAQRFGDDVLVTWRWPEGTSAADVTWSGGRRRITVRQFRDEGGCHLVDVPAVRRIDVTAILPGDDECRAPLVSVEVAGRATTIGYELRRRGHRLAGGVRCSVTLVSAESVPAATVVLVASPGPVMPVAPTDRCVQLLRADVSLAPNTPTVLPEVTVPGTLRRPYWLRCFLAGPGQAAVLTDPPVSQLKVS